MNTGVIVCETDRVLPLSQSPTATGSDAKAPSNANPMTDGEEDENEEEVEDAVEPTKILEEVATFDDILVWGHEQVPSEEDVFVRGVQEWLAFAEAMHGVGGEEKKKEATIEPPTP